MGGGKRPRGIKLSKKRPRQEVDSTTAPEVSHKKARADDADGVDEVTDGVELYHAALVEIEERNDLEKAAQLFEGAIHEMEPRWTTLLATGDATLIAALGSAWCNLGVLRNDTGFLIRGLQRLEEAAAQSASADGITRIQYAKARFTVSRYTIAAQKFLSAGVDATGDVGATGTDEGQETAGDESEGAVATLTNDGPSTTGEGDAIQTAVGSTVTAGEGDELMRVLDAVERAEVAAALSHMAAVDAASLVETAADKVAIVRLVVAYAQTLDTEDLAQVHAAITAALGPLVVALQSDDQATDRFNAQIEMASFVTDAAEALNGINQNEEARTCLARCEQLCAELDAQVVDEHNVSVARLMCVKGYLELARGNIVAEDEAEAQASYTEAYRLLKVANDHSPGAVSEAELKEMLELSHL